MKENFCKKTNWIKRVNHVIKEDDRKWVNISECGCHFEVIPLESEKIILPSFPNIPHIVAKTKNGWNVYNCITRDRWIENRPTKEEAIEKTIKASNAHFTDINRLTRNGIFAEQLFAYSLYSAYMRRCGCSVQTYIERM
jgi:hypothetical protein